MTSPRLTHAERQSTNQRNMVFNIIFNFFNSFFVWLYPFDSSVLVEMLFAAKIYQSFLLSVFYVVLFFPIFWKKAIKSLVIFFTFFGLVIIGA